MIQNIIDFNLPVAKLIDQHPELLGLLVDLGFKPLAHPMMRRTVGRSVSLNQGSKITGIPLATIVQELEWNGYTVTGVKSDDK